MAIPEKTEGECCKVTVNLCGEAKKIVKAKQKELKESKLPYAKSLVIVKLILGK